METETTIHSMMTIVLASAGTAALISSIFALLGQFFDRRSRRKEILLQGALSLAARRTNLVKDAAIHNGEEAEFIDEAHLVATYYYELDHLMKRTALSNEFKKLGEKSQPPLSPFE